MQQDKLNLIIPHMHIFDLTTSDRIFEPLDDEPIGGYAISGVIQYGNYCYGTFNEMILKSFTLINVTSWFNGQPVGSPVIAYYDIDFGNGVTVNIVGGTAVCTSERKERIVNYSVNSTHVLQCKIEYWRSSHIPFFWMKLPNGIADVKHFEKVDNVWKVKKHKL